ncbi:MAG TPA: hypothetical protein VFO77_16620 [Actinoplanes sp.]|nr:hypothetical protein [Actinoplanes sp.]
MKARSLHILATVLFGGLLLASCSTDTTTTSGTAPTPSLAPGVHSVDVIFLDHPPMKPVLAEVDTVLARYAGKISVNKLPADGAEGARRAEDLGLSGHIAFVVAIDGSTEADIGGRTVRFEGFPVGKSPIDSAQGAWSVADLDAVLAQRTG